MTNVNNIDEVVIGMGATYVMYSDCEPYEVIAKKGKTVSLRAMNAVRDESVKMDFKVGGFSAHCSNNREQKWIYSSNPDGKVVKVRFSNSKSKYRAWYKGDMRFEIGSAVKFYDYNF